MISDGNFGRSVVISENDFGRCEVNKHPGIP